jgi:hypothetical protein
MIQGLRTVIYPVTALLEATDWYRRVLDKAPYFEQPFYVGFEVGGFELGLVPDGVPGRAGRAGAAGSARRDGRVARGGRRRRNPRCDRARPVRQPVRHYRKSALRPRQARLS